MLNWIEFERLSLHRDTLTPDEQKRFDTLARADQDAERRVSHWLVVGIFAMWALLLAAAGLLGMLGALLDSAA